jgi:DNA-binding NtrC family response regulator
VRLVATTNRDLLREVEAGRFRRDLYYRLSVVPICTPPLRDRIEDIPILVEHFVRQAANQVGRRPPRVAPEAIAALQRRTWPGNIRELANMVERAVILTRGDVLPAAAFGPEIDAAPVAPPTPQASPSGSTVLPFDLGALERDAIDRALQATGGHRARAARLLGMSERTLRNKLNPPRAASGL